MQSSFEPPRIIERPRITQHLRQLLETSHVFLTTPAGYGKSVALRSFSQTQPYSHHVTLSPEDLDLVTLQARLRPFLQPNNIILLDDVHLLAGGTDVCVWLQQQLAQPKPRWVLAGRSLPFAIDLLLVSGQAVQITKKLLAFSLPEAQALLPESEAKAADWQARLAGWPLALSLLSRLPAASERLLVAEAHLFAYLTEAVFAQLSPELKRFMQLTAVPRQFNAALATALWPKPKEAAECLTAVLQNDLYIQPATKPGWYRYNDLIRDYLLRQLGDERLAVAETAVAWLWQHDERHTAVEQALEAGLTNRAAELIGQISLMDFHGSSSYYTYRRWVRALDEKALTTNLMLLVRLANVIQMMPGYEDEAQAYARQAIRLAAKADRPHTMLLAQANLAHWHYQRGELTAGREIILETLAHPDCNEYPRLFALRIASLILSDLGAYHEALPYFEQAIALAVAMNTQNEPFMNRANLALKYLLPLGKIEAAEQELTAVLDHFSGATGWQAQYLTYWCELQLTKGSWTGLAQAVAQLEATLSKVETQTRHNEIWLAHYKTVLAIVSDDEDEVQFALAQYDSLATSSQLHQVCVSWLACWHLRRQGAWAEAVARGESALAQSSQFAYYRARLALEVDIALGMQFLAGQVGSFEPRSDTLRLIGWRSRLELVRLRALLALVCWQQNDPRWRRHWTAVHYRTDVEFLSQRDPELAAYFWRLAPLVGEKLVGAADVFQQNGRIDLLLPLLSHEMPTVRGRTAELLGLVGDERGMPGLMAALATEKDATTQHAIEQALFTLENTPPPPLTVQLMGPFRLKRGNVWIDDDAWYRPVVLRLFQYFALHAGQSRSKDQILEALWPDSDPERAWGTFRTVYSRLRKVLEPALRAKSANRYIEVRGETFILNAAFVRLDVTEFEAVVTAVLQTHQPDTVPQLSKPLLHALTNYAPLLPGLPYADWLLEPRQKLEELYIEGSLYVAHAYLARADLAQAAAWARQTIEAAPWLEEAYRLLMRSYARQGQRSQSLRVYEEAVANLQHELSLPPSEKTTWLAERLRRGESI